MGHFECLYRLIQSLPHRKFSTSTQNAGILKYSSETVSRTRLRQVPTSQKTRRYEDVANSFIYPLSVLHSFRVCRLIRWRVQLFQKLCFTRDFCSKCFLDVNRGICALFGICSFIAWSGATVWSMTQEKICKPCACTKCKPCCSWQVLPPYY